MASYTITLPIDGNSYHFKGFGTHTPLYEKGLPLDYSGHMLGDTNFNSICDNYLKYFSWMRTMILGGEQYKESLDNKTNYPNRAQSKYLQVMNQRCGGFRYIVTPVTAPPVTMANGFSRMIYDDLKNIWTSTATATINADQSFVDTVANWQVWADAIEDGINKLQSAGCSVEYVTTPNEDAGASGIGNYWLVYLTAAQQIEFVKNVWLGQNIQGGGISQRFPGLFLIGGDYITNLQGDSTAKAAVKAWDGHYYSDGILTGQYGNNSASYIGTYTATECGYFGSYGQNASKRVIHGIHDLLVYAHVGIICNWTIGRDNSGKGIPSQENNTYTAKGILNYNVNAGTFAVTPFWYLWLPYLLACGRGESDILSDALPTSVDTNTTWNPGGSSVALYVTHFIRGTDGKQCTVISNCSQSSQTITINYTQGGSAHSMSGTQRTFTTETMTDSGTSATGPASSFTLTLPGSATDNTIVLLELS